MSASPIDNRPRVFQAGTLFNRRTYDRVLSSVFTRDDVRIQRATTDDVECDNSDDNDDDDDDTHEVAMDRERNEKIRHLTQVIRTEQPIDDDVARSIMEQLDDLLPPATVNQEDSMPSSSTTMSAMTTAHPYPPVHRTGLIAEHDRPHADDGHLD